MRKRLPIAQLNGLKRLLDDGGKIEVVAQKDVDYSLPIWTGQWQFYGIEAETGYRFEYVQQDMEPKIIKTATSVMQQCKKLGLVAPTIPIYKGQRVQFTRDTVKILKNE